MGRVAKAATAQDNSSTDSSPDSTIFLADSMGLPVRTTALSFFHNFKVSMPFLEN